MPLSKLKNNKPITIVTVYDAVNASIAEQTNIDVLLVGDSLGTNVLGYDSGKEVTLADMIHHTKAVRRGAKESIVMSDLPYSTYETSSDAISNAKQLIEAGADIVKLEGCNDMIEKISKEGIPVCAHLGYLPQFHEKPSAHGKEYDSAVKLIEEAKTIEKYGAKMVVLELMPAELAKIITEVLDIPTIGIGAGAYTDGQVQVLNDVLGITTRKIKHAGVFADIYSEMKNAMQAYKDETKSSGFPTELNSTHIDEELITKLKEYAAI